ncbi:MAG: hypothetical protein V3V74_07150 [Nitrosomonadaceae bacterium]
MSVLNRKQQEALDKVPKLQAKFVESLTATKGKDLKDTLINRGYALCDNSDELLAIIQHLKNEVTLARSQANTAVTLMQNKGRKLKSIAREQYQNRTQ